ncbi:MAG TPA: RpiB/LacA/LacB family sugar-phosphate isomerase [Candidatus Gallacutalibacter pullicola]|uniref:RpiB/LacA/LacB family sugar-phosphate isomerase n=1 Tax=Candidatus Gallacutalibacter pullicola TaxID=2840830 RepID=A0A9D1J178_9FIRM|nr:RpiB/LacA/LacB family sugar-phosphate isomerase [Candidatus Gallacutalibacter pullicola]
MIKGGVFVKIAVITEGSTKHHNADVMKALEGMGHEVVNLGMKNVDGEPDLTYMETGLMTAIALNLKAVDFVVGGCGTGQGYMNAVLQYPGVFCGLIMDPVEAFLYSQVNAGNCISLQLNKGYGGIGGDLNVKYILEKLFNDTYGQGYPAARKAVQVDARKRLETLSQQSHRPMTEILKTIDPQLIRRTLDFPGVREFFAAAPESELKDVVMSLY